MVGIIEHADRRGISRLRIAEAAAVALLLGLHAWLAISSGRGKSAAFDEIAHLGGGYLQWTAGDYRFNAESGVLPQRWAAWPLLMFDLGVPPADHPARRGANVWILGRELLYGQGLDAEALLQAGRGMIVLLSMVLGGLVYAWSRACYGAGGGLLSLALYASSPTMLAHARLITADLAAACFFLLSTAALWRVLDRVTPARLTAAALATSGLLLSKMSGILILPMAAILVLLRLARGRPLRLSWGVSPAAGVEVVSRGRQALAFAAISGVVALAVLGAVWSAYGWRYSAQPETLLGGSEFLHSFESVLERGGAAGSVLAAARDARLLPEAYLWGLAYTFDTTRERDAFLRGRTSRTGWWWFFPYAVAVKTPLALFALLGLAAASARFAARPGGADRFAASPTAPLWVLLAVYSLAAVASHLNIGHRHMLPIYPALMVLAGGAGRWLTRRTPWLATWVLLCLGSFVWESGKIRPHYLSYFNQLAGGPGQGYRHLVDSSLDWGQDLPGLAAYLERLRALEGDAPEPTPIYVAYFGAEPPVYHGVDARWLYSFFPVADPSRPPPPLTGGVYCVSATLLQTMHIELPGPWNEEREQDYRRLRGQVERLLRAAAAERRSPADRARIFRSYERLRSARLFAFLRRREPDSRIGFSIHVYRLSDAEVERALNGAP